MHRKKYIFRALGLGSFFPTKLAVNGFLIVFFLHGKCCFNTDFTFLEKSKVKVKAFAHAQEHMIQGLLA